QWANTNPSLEQTPSNKADIRTGSQETCCYASNRQSKQLVQAAVCESPIQNFEGADLSFYNDMTRSTMV
ncbi:Hypothetical predicted protein, partial [Pelobates cultripes]